MVPMPDSRPVDLSGGWEVRCGSALHELRTVPDLSVQCCVTSPPYFGMRDYDVPGQIGTEPTEDEFIGTLVNVFRGVRETLH